MVRALSISDREVGSVDENTEGAVASRLPLLGAV